MKIKRQRGDSERDYLDCSEKLWQIGELKSIDRLLKTPFRESHCFSTFMALTGDTEKPEAEGVQRLNSLTGRRSVIVETGLVKSDKYGCKVEMVRGAVWWLWPLLDPWGP